MVNQEIEFLRNAMKNTKDKRLWFWVPDTIRN